MKERAQVYTGNSSLSTALLTRPSSLPALDDYQVEALHHAADLVEGGCTVLALGPWSQVKLDVTSPGKGWESMPGLTVQGLAKWDPSTSSGLALRSGTVFDAIDVDTDSGKPGEETAARALAEGVWPDVTFGQAATPSGGRHYLVKCVGRPKASGGGIDYQRGTTEGSGRGLLFIAPTRRLAREDRDARRADAPLVGYRWVAPPMLDTVEDEDPPTEFADWFDLIARAGERRERVANAGLAVDAPEDDVPEESWNAMTRGKVAEVVQLVMDAPVGKRHNRLVSASGRLGMYVGEGRLSRRQAFEVVREAVAASEHCDKAFWAEEKGHVAGSIEWGIVHSDPAFHVSRAVRVAAGEPEGAEGPVLDDPTEVENLPENLPVEWYSRYGWAAKLREAARSRCASPCSVLGASLALFSAQVPPSLTVDAGQGPASLNFYAALVGRSSSGKSKSVNLAEALVPAPVTDRYSTTRLPVGTGEGLIDTYLSEETVEREDGGAERVLRQVVPGAFFVMDEAEAFMRMESRPGSTLGTTVRSMWSAGQAGMTNTKAGGRRRVLGKGTYALGMVWAFQDKTIAPFLADSAGGTPARFVLFRTTTRDMPETEGETPAFPGVLENVAHAVDPDGGPLVVAPEIRSAVWRINRDNTDADKVSDESGEGHDVLLQLKMSALFALLDLRRRVEWSDWEAAGEVLHVSRSLKRVLLAKAAAELQRREDREDERAVRVAARSAAAAEDARGAREARVRARLRDWWVKQLDGRGWVQVVGRAGALQKVKGAERSVAREVLMELMVEGVVEEVGGRVQLLRPPC